MTTSTSIDLDLAPVQRLLDRHLAINRPYEVGIDALRLTMLPGVFCPAFTTTSRFLAQHTKVGSGDRVLDMFSGSGYQGLVAAKTAAKVVCVDAYEAATACARANAEANHVSHKVTVHTGDLFEPVRGERFHVVIANPPLLPGRPQTALEAAVFDEGLRTTRRFVDGIGAHLTGDGVCYLLGTDAHQSLGILDIETYAVSLGLSVSVVATLRMPYETYTTYAIRPECC